MGILKEKPELIDSLYMSWTFDNEVDFNEVMEGFKPLTPEIGPVINKYDYDIGKNSIDRIVMQYGFSDKNYFETFTNDFPRAPYKI